MSGALFPLVRASLRTGGHRLFAGLVPVFSAAALVLPLPLRDSLTCRSGSWPSCAFQLCSEARQLLGYFAQPTLCVVGHPCSVAQSAFVGIQSRAPFGAGPVFA